MKLYIFAVSFACTFLLSKTSLAREVNISPRLDKGTAARPGQFPWLVPILSKKLDGNTSHRSGSLIAPEWVLTGANSVNGAKEIELHFGGVTLNALEKGKTVLVSKCYIIHPDYDNNRYVDNNIALIRLPEAINYTSTIRPIALPDADQPVEAGIDVTVNGFGRTKETNNYGVIYSKHKTISNAACGRIYSMTVHPSIFCTLSDPKEDICSYIGPVVTFDNKNKATVVGILTFAGNCAKGNPAGHMRISVYRKWISVYTGV